MAIKILIADDHAIVRQGVRTLLEREQDFEVVGDAADGAEALRLAELLVPEVVVLDVKMPGMNGIEASRRIHELNPGARIIILATTADRICVTTALRNGAVGYLLKDCGIEELALAIRSATTQLPYLCREVTALVVRTVGSADPSPPPHAVLSPREREVLRLIAAGKSTKEIAFHFSVSTKTIETQRKSIMKKLDRHNVAQLIKYAVSTGLSPLED